MPTMMNSTAGKNSSAYERRARQDDPEAQSTRHILSETDTNRSSFQRSRSSSMPQERQNEQERKINTYSGLPRVLDFFWGGVYAPGASTHDPIEILLNTEEVGEKDRLTELWRDNRLNELSFVGVVVGLNVISRTCM